MKKHKSLFLSILSGVLLSIAWPATGGFAPLLFIGLVPLLFVEEFIYKGRVKGGMFGYAFVCFLTWNSLTTWWIYCVSEDFATKILVVSAAVLVNSCLMAIVFTLFHFTKRKIGEKEGYISLIFYWLGFEYLHFYWDLTWTWLTLGNGFADYTKWIQWYEYTGVFGGSLWVLLTNAVFFLLLREGLIYKKPIKKNKKLISVLSALIIIPMLISQLIYDNYRESLMPVNVVIVQPNIDPYNEKYNTSYKEQLSKLLQLAASETDSTTRYVVAPETALTENLWENELHDSYSINAIRAFVMKYPNLKFVVGASSYKMFMPGEALSNTARQFTDETGWYDAYNTALQIDNTGQIQIYHKSKLVQGVEFIPFAAIIKPMEKLSLNLGGTTGSLGTQEEPGVFASPDDTLTIAPVICYESIYGEYVSEYIRKGADLIFIITNDGWWDDTPGYKQHMAYARLRAIETRRSIARSANTGISCFINQKGDVLQSTDWWKPAVIKAKLNANSELTFYTKYGDYIGRIASFVAVLLLVYAVVRSLNKTQNEPSLSK